MTPKSLLHAYDFHLGDVVRLGDASRVVKATADGYVFASEGKPHLPAFPVGSDSPDVWVQRGGLLVEPVCPWVYDRWAVLDTETTGTGPSARIVEVALVTMRFGRVEDVFASLVHPGRPIPPEATAIHGITDAMVAQAPTLAGLLPTLEEKLRRCRVAAGYNIAGYDEPVLRGHGFRLRLPVIDAMPLAREHAVSTSGQPARFWKSTSEKVERDVDEDEEDFSAATVSWKRVGRHSLARMAVELGLDKPEDGVEAALHRASWDAILTGRLLWALRHWCSWDAEGMDAHLRSLLERQSASMEAFIRKAQAERAAKRKPPEQKLLEAWELIKSAMREQASFDVWRSGSEP